MKGLVLPLGWVGKQTGGGDTKTHAHLPSQVRLVPTFHCGRVCHTQGYTHGYKHMWTTTHHSQAPETQPDSGQAPYGHMRHRCDAFTHQCVTSHSPAPPVTNTHTLSPPGQAVTDSYPVHQLTHTAARNWGTRGQSRLQPHPSKGTICALPPRRPRGLRGWFYMQETQVFTIVYF